MALQTGTAPPAASGALQGCCGQSGHPSGDVSPLCRLVQRVPAGVGQLHLPGCPQHAHDLHRVVDLRNRELLDRSAETGELQGGGQGRTQSGVCSSRRGRERFSTGHSHPALTLSSPPGLLSVIELSAQSIIYEVSVVAFMVRAGGYHFRAGLPGDTPGTGTRQKSAPANLALPPLHLSFPLLPPIPPVEMF